MVGLVLLVVFVVLFCSCCCSCPFLLFLSTFFCVIVAVLTALSVVVVIVIAFRQEIRWCQGTTGRCIFFQVGCYFNSGAIHNDYRNTGVFVFAEIQPRGGGELKHLGWFIFSYFTAKYPDGSLLRGGCANFKLWPNHR